MGNRTRVSTTGTHRMPNDQFFMTRCTRDSTATPSCAAT